MKSFVFLAFLLVILSFGAYSYGMKIEMTMRRDPKNPGMCTIDDGMILKPGEVKNNPHGRCEQLICYENGQTSTVKCVEQGMRDGCHEGEFLQPNAVYPHCCKRAIKCKTDYYSN